MEMKKIAALLLSICMAFSLSACGGTADSKEQTSAQETPADSEVQAADQDADASDSDGSEDAEEAKAAEDQPEAGEASDVQQGKILVAYFTYGENAELSSDVDASSSASIQILNGEVTGNTGLMAHMVADASGGDLFSIQTAEPYPDNYDDTLDIGQAEKENGTHPELSTHIEDLEQYDTIFVGFPNWWYGMPMVMYSFFGEYDFSGKTIIPFCTSGGSAFSDAIEEIQSAEPGAEVLDGLHVGASNIADAKADVEGWVDELGLSR